MHSKLENAWNVADTIRISEMAEQYWTLLDIISNN